MAGMLLLAQRYGLRGLSMTTLAAEFLGGAGFARDLMNWNWRSSMRQLGASGSRRYA